MEVGEVVEVQDDQSVVSLKSNDSDTKKKTIKENNGWTNAIILLGIHFAFSTYIVYCIHSLHNLD